MKFDKGLIAGSSTLLVLTLLESGDMYGYQMIEELSRRSNDAFQFQEGTLYPILHGLEKGEVSERLSAAGPLRPDAEVLPAHPEGAGAAGGEEGGVGQLPPWRGRRALRRSQRSGMKGMRGWRR